jgi:hypothetical protein
MTANQTARLEHLLAIEFLAPFEAAELDRLMEQGYEESMQDQWERESRQELWAEQGGYAAGLARPV